MFVDASVVVAVLAQEPGASALEERLEAVGGPFYVSPLVRFEAAIGLSRALGPKGRRPSPATIARAEAAVDAFFEAIDAQMVVVDGETAAHATAAAKTYGKAIGHPADLNFGDCFAYACAKTLGVALLYRGNDFALTDLA
jgi:ribonuclease VapC